MCSLHTAYFKTFYMKVKQIMISCPNCGARSNANYKPKDKEAKTDCRNCKTKLVKKWQN